MLTDTAGIIRYHTPPGPASPQEITRLRQYKQEIRNCLDERDCVVLDSGFEGVNTQELQLPGTWLIKARKNAIVNNIELEDANKKIETIRRLIETRGFQQLTSLFQIFQKPFAFSRTLFPNILNFTIAIHNLRILYKMVGEANEWPTEWCGVVTMLPEQLRIHQGYHGTVSLFSFFYNVSTIMVPTY